MAEADFPNMDLTTFLSNCPILKVSIVGAGWRMLTTFFSRVSRIVFRYDMMKTYDVTWRPLQNIVTELSKLREDVRCSTQTDAKYKYCGCFVDIYEWRWTK